MIIIPISKVAVGGKGRKLQSLGFTKQRKPWESKGICFPRSRRQPSALPGGADVGCVLSGCGYFPGERAAKLTWDINTLHASLMKIGYNLYLLEHILLRT